MSGADLPDDDEVLAAELAFGLIDGNEKQAAERRLGQDAHFAAAYDRWLSYAAALADDATEVPRPSLWGAIAARLPANDKAPAPRNALRWWQAGTLAASLLAIVLAAVAFQPRPKPIQPQPVVVTAPPVMPLVAVLTGKLGVVTVSYDRASGRMVSATKGIAIGDHSPELWVIPADGKPRSLGLIAAGAPLWKPVPKALENTLTAGVTLAISVEPLGGSPTGQPTGPVILTGKVTTA